MNIKTILQLTKFELFRFFRNRALVFVSLVGPIIVLTIFAIVAYREPQNIDIGIINNNQNSLSKTIVQNIQSENKLILRSFDSLDQAEAAIKKDKIKAIVIVDVENNTGVIKTIDDPRYPEIQGKVRQKIAEAVKSTLTQNVTENINQEIENQFHVQNVSLTINAELIKIENEENTPKQIKYFDRFAAGILALIIVLICLQRSASSLSADRDDGIIERLFASPFSKTQIISSKLLSNIGIGFLTALMTLLVFKFGFKSAIGNTELILLILFLNATIAVAVGTFVSVITSSSVTAIQAVFLIFFAAVLTSGFFFAQENIYPKLNFIMRLDPFYYSVSALRKVNLFNWGFYEIRYELLILVISAILFSTLAIILLRRQSD